MSVHCFCISCFKVKDHHIWKHIRDMWNTFSINVFSIKDMETDLYFPQALKRSKVDADIIKNFILPVLSISVLFIQSCH